MILKFYGKEREATLRRLVDEWLPGNVPVAILQGFPGCGKSQLARDVAEKAERSLPPFEPQIDSADPVQDLFLDLAITLEQNGSPRLGQEIDKGAQANFGKALLDTLHSERVLIIVDEFQRFFPKETTTPPGPWRTLVEKLGNSPKPRGRLLLISNRAIKPERWCENCRFEEVKGLTDEEAEALFSDLLESSGLGAKVPPERRREIGHRLGGNPRALTTLVFSLGTESLDDLLSAAPDLMKPGDVVLDPRLIEDFERELLNRALPKLDTDLLKFMRWLSVHRRPFRKEALAQFTGGRETPEALRKRLFERFLLTQTIGGDVPHPLAREISVNRLRAGQGEWTQAHSLAANYYLRHFKARQPKGASTLVVSYTELRHHLHEAGRISELSEVSERLTRFALSQIHLTTPVPKNQGALEERIALLSALPDDQRPKVLEYHLARCLIKRGKAGDKEKALKHARKGTGRHPHAAAWLLRLNLEYELHGINTALPMVSEALRNVGPDAASIYQRGAELMAKADRLDDAITLLEKGIAVVPAVANVYSLYQACAELMAKADRLDDAITLLEKGIAVPGMTSLSSLYQACAEFMAKADRLDDAITLLEKGIAVVPAVANVYSLYQACAELMAKADRLDDAITLLEKGIAVPGMTSLFSLYQSCAELMAKANRLDGAIKARVEALITKGLAAIPRHQNRYKIADTALRIFAGQGDSEAILRLQSLTGSAQLDPPQQAFAESFLIRLSGDWEKAADSAHQGMADFPNYVSFRGFEVDARLALGQIAKADELMRDYRVGETQTRDNPVVWLKAYVSLIAGHTDEAKSLTAMYAPFDFDSDRPLDEAELVRLWTVARSGMNGLIETNFPGLANFLKRNTLTERTEEPPVADPTRQPCVLAVATEWDSHHGGLSTFNRELCLALAQAGHQVACLVPDAKVEERDQARQRGVLLIVAREDAG